MFPILVITILTSWFFYAKTVFCAPQGDELMYTFFDTYDTVWPDNANKLAYTFLSSFGDDTIGNSTMLVVDGKFILDPEVPPNEETRNTLIEWLDTTAFDPSIRYYQILKDWENDTYEIPQEEVIRMERTIRNRLNVPRDLSRLWNQKPKFAIKTRRCDNNYMCIIAGEGHTCRQSRSGRSCQPSPRVTML